MGVVLLVPEDDAYSGARMVARHQHPWTRATTQTLRKSDPAASAQVSKHTLQPCAIRVHPAPPALQRHYGRSIDVDYIRERRRHQRVAPPTRNLRVGQTGLFGIVERRIVRTQRDELTTV